MADEVVSAAAEPKQLTLEEELAAIAPPPESAEPEPEVAKEEEKPVEAPPSIDEQLKTIDEPPVEPEAAKSPLSPEVQEIVSIFPDANTAKRVAATAESYQNFTRTFEAGKFDEVEGMFQEWVANIGKPDLYNKFRVHIVDQWIKETEANQANPAVNGKLTALEQQLRQLQNERQSQAQQAQMEAQRQRDVQAGNAYKAHLESLFDKINFSKADRRWVTADIGSRLDPKTTQMILAGNPAAVNGIFKQAVREYVHRDQAAAQMQEATLKDQEKHKPPMQSAQQPTPPLTDEVIKAAPKAQRAELLDAKLDQELGAFANKVKGRR